MYTPQPLNLMNQTANNYVCAGYPGRCPICGGVLVLIIKYTTAGEYRKEICLDAKSAACPS